MLNSATPMAQKCLPHSILASWSMSPQDLIGEDGVSKLNPISRTPTLPRRGFKVDLQRIRYRLVPVPGQHKFLETCAPAACLEMSGMTSLWMTDSRLQSVAEPAGPVCRQDCPCCQSM